MPPATIISTPVQKSAQQCRRPIVYVCLMSDFTVASAQSIRATEPDLVIAITSLKMADSTKLFAQRLKEWGIPLTVVGGEQAAPFPAESLQDSKQWMLDHLCPLLEQHKQKDTLYFANLTGSTKAAAIALDACWAWDERHYTAERTRNMLNVVDHPSGMKDFALSPLELLDEVRLLNPEVRQQQPKLPCEDVEILRKAAQQIFDDYDKGPEHSILGRFGKDLGYLWFEKEKSEEELNRRGLRIEGKSAFVRDEDLQSFLLSFQALDPSAVYRVGNSLRVPADRKHAWVNFLTGGWWELLVEAWIQEHGAPVTSNIVIVRETQKTADTETDILVRRAGGDLAAIECKAAVPVAAGSIDIVKILNDLSRQFGKTTAALAIGPAFWWVFATENQKDNFREACTLRKIEILDSREDILNWVGTPEADSLPPYTVEFVRTQRRPSSDIVAEASALLGAWSDDKKQRFSDLLLELRSGYPELKSTAQDLEARNKEFYALCENAYKAGAGSTKVPPLRDLLARAEQLSVPGLKERMERQCEMGRKSRERFQKEYRRKAGGQPLSSVKPRPNQSQPLHLPKVKASARHLPPVPAGLHPNDIRALSPASDWTLLLDETGSDFQGGQGKQQGRFVGLLVSTAQSGLHPLPKNWHAIECEDSSEIDQVMQAVLDAPCGVIGLSLNALPQTQGERWLDGMMALVDWVVRLIPLDGLTRLRVCIEGRPPYPPKIDAEFAARNTLARLARTWPDRARSIDLRIETVGKSDHSLNGYVDAVAFTWGSPAASAKERLKCSGLRDTCLLSADVQALAAFWDSWDRPGSVTAQDWSVFVASSAARQPHSIVHALLAELSRACQADPSRVRPFLEETQRHLSSKALDLSQLAAEVAWLAPILGDSSELTPTMRLVWMTVQLAQANHMGLTQAHDLEAFQKLGSLLRDEDAPRVCHADLNLAVQRTNIFDFQSGEEVLAPWSDADPAVPGLRYWGQVQSSLGQLAAFNGRNETAVRYFESALDAFRRLSDPRQSARECSQTLCYRLIAGMDADNGADNGAEFPLDVWFREYFASLDLPQDAVGLAEKLSVDADNRFKFTHHVVLRWLVFHGDEEASRAYCRHRENWETGEGHPWPLIHLYRALLIRQSAPEDALEQCLLAAGLAFGAGQGDTVRLIGACCRSVAVTWGAPWAEAGDVLDSLARALPLAQDRIERLRTWMAQPDETPRELLAQVLPFNFH